MDGNLSFDNIGCQDLPEDPALELLKKGFLDVHRRQADSVKSLGILLRMAKAVTDDRSAEDLCKEIVGIIIEETGFENASLLLYDRNDDSLKLTAAKGVIQILAGKVDRPYNQNLQFRRGEGLAWQVFDTLTPAFINDTSQEPFEPKGGATIRPRSIACLPVKGKGVINLSSSRPAEFQSYQKRDLVIVADVIGHLLQSTELRERLNTSHLHLQQLVEAKTTELHRVNKELRATMSYMQSVIQNAPQGICLLDPDGDVRHVNPSFLAILDCSPEYIVGRSPARLFFHAGDYLILRNAMTRKGLVRISDVSILRPDGSTIPADMFLHPLLDPEDRQSGGMLILHDLSRQKAEAEKLLHTEKLRALGSMAGGVAHDFNNLLTTILGNVELLQKGIKDPEGLRRLKTIKMAVHDGAFTVRRLQTLTGLKYGQNTGTATIRPDTVVHDAIEMTRPKWRDECQKRGVTIDVILELEETKPVAIGQTELREVLVNLIFNAIDAMPNGGRLSLRSRQTDSDVVLEIEDTGIGMSEDTRRRIFDPFFSTKGVGNSGLGLSVSYGLIARAGGSIEIATKEGKGTTFFLTLHACTQDKEGDAESEKENPRPADRELRVLVVDDEEQIVDLLSTMLKNAGHQPTGVLSGTAAAAHLEENQFDVVITDLGMPEMSGWEVASAAKRIHPETAVILLTGWGAEYEGKDLSASGVDAVLSKPFRFEQLAKALSTLVMRTPG
jgi:PAS domain S-box-containing protein